MPIGPFQRLPGSSEAGVGEAAMPEPWLLPISDALRLEAGPDALSVAVRQAARPFWVAATALCAALGMLFTVECTTGCVGGGWGRTQAPVTVVPSTPAASGAVVLASPRGA